MRLSGPVTLLLALAIPSILPAVARADGPAAPVVLGADEVALKNGGMLRGTLIAVEPDKHVIIVVGGEQRVVPWADVARVERARDAQPPAPPPPPPATSPPAPPLAAAQAPAALGQGTPFVHIDSDWPDVQLARIDGELLYSTSSRTFPAGVANGLIHPVCRAPCDRVVDGRDGNRFVFISPGMVPSEPFFLDDKRGNVVARVHGGSFGRRIGGVMLATIGGSLTIGGGAILGVALAMNAHDDRNTGTVGLAGTIVFGLGVAQLVPGIILLATSSTEAQITQQGGVAVGRFRFEGGRILF